MLLLFFIDYTIKSFIVKHFPPGIEKPVLKNRIILRHTKNYGAIFNLGQKHLALVIMASVPVLTIIGCSYLNSLFHKKSLLETGGLALITAGGLSNTFERIMRGHVIDYFSFNPKRWPFLSNIVFNLGDIYIFGGVLLCAWNSLKK